MLHLRWTSTLGALISFDEISCTIPPAQPVVGDKLLVTLFELPKVAYRNTVGYRKSNRYCAEKEATSLWYSPLGEINWALISHSNRQQDNCRCCRI